MGTLHVFFIFLYEVEILPLLENIDKFNKFNRVEIIVCTLDLNSPSILELC